MEALGTQFNVSVKNGVTAVSLLEGRVEVRRLDGSGAIRLGPGEAVTMVERTPTPPEPRRADLDTAIAWTERRLVFEDAPLSEVIAEFNRYSRQPFSIGDPELGRLRITASFDSTSVQTFASSLAVAGGLRVTHRADEGWLIEKP